MTDAALVALRRLLLERYDDLKARLTTRLGSADLAGDALQDTWLRLARAETVGTIRSPASYLFRIILNVAQDNKRAQKRNLTSIEIENLLNRADDAPPLARIVEARSDLRAFEAVLEELPPLRRAILLAARLDNLPLQKIADSLGISLRLVSKELRIAHEYLVARRKKMMD